MELPGRIQGKPEPPFLHGNIFPEVKARILHRPEVRTTVKNDDATSKHLRLQFPER